MNKSNENYIRERWDIDGLFEIGFIDTKTDFVKIEKRIVTFFGLQNIYQYDNMNADTNSLKAKNIFSKN